MKRSLFAAILLVLPAGAAHAWECLPAQSSGPTLTWRSRCVPFYVAGNGTILNEHEAAVMAALSGWSNAECSDMQLEYGGVTDQPLGFRPNTDEVQQNTIAVSKNVQAFPDQGLVVFELTSFNAESGEILDADVLFNDLTFDFDVLTEEQGCNNVFDLESVLSYELGRTVGIQSTKKVELCDVDQRALSEDELAGLCTVYPAGQPTEPCVAPEKYEPVQGLHANICRSLGLAEVSACGCTDARERGANGAGLFAAALILFVLSRAARR